MRDCLKKVDIIVLAGGRGTRVASALKGKPKILAPLGKRLYIDLLLKWLEHYGAQRVIFSLGYLSDQIIGYLTSLKLVSMEFEIVVEESPLGTAGAISNSRSHIITDSILVLNGDSFVNADLCAFLDFHLSERNKASIICGYVDDTSRFGTVKLSSENKIISFVEKENNSNPGYINAGVYFFNRSSINEISAVGPSLEMDYLNNQGPGVIGAMVGKYEFLDIGTPDALSKAPDILGNFFN